MPWRAAKVIIKVRSTMMTPNRLLEGWGKLIGDVPAAAAILDRLLHHAEVITITGESYRLRNQARRSNGLRNRNGKDGEASDSCQEQAK